MNIKEIVKTELILKVLYVLSWIIFIGVCVEAGGLIFSTIFTMVSNPFGATYFWNNADLSSLYAWDSVYFFIETFFICLAAVLKAFMFYLIIRILHGNRFDAARPFTKEVGRFIFNLSYLSFGIGLLSAWGANYAKWFITQGVTMPDAQTLRVDGADVWFLMGVALFVVAQIFKRGIEIQTENELTV